MITAVDHDRPWGNSKQHHLPMEANLNRCIKSIRQTFNDPEYALSALRSDQTNGTSPDQSAPDEPDTQVDQSQAQRSVMALSDTGVDESHELGVEEDVGSKSEVIHLYSKQTSRHGTPYFTTILPPDVRLRREVGGDQERTKKHVKTFAIIHRHVAHEGQTRGHSIEIQKKRLKDYLSVIFKDYPDIDLAAPKLEFSPGFEPFVHQWDRLAAIQTGEDDEEGRKLLKILMDTLSKELEDSFHAYHEFQKTGYISYDNILLAYKPGGIIVRSKQGILSAGLLKQYKKENYVWIPEKDRYLSLKVDVLVWDGEMCGYREEKWKIQPFEGLQRMVDTEFFPLDSHEQREQIKDHLIERDKIFESLCGCYMQNFQGHVASSESWFDGNIYAS